MLLQLEDQPLNRFSTPDLYAFPQSAQMTAAINARITRLEFDKKFFGGLIWMLFQPLMHLSQVSHAAVRNRCRPARLVPETAIFAWRDDDAASTRILAPLFHAFFELPS
jgi:hypothetical protein